MKSEMEKVAKLGWGVLAAIVALKVGAGEDLTRYVDPFVGTAGTGHTTPAACVPFGLIQAGPDTGTENWAYCGGYQYEDKKIVGFTQTHINGTGRGDLGDLRLLPFVGETVPEALAYDKTSEKAKVGGYDVALKGVEVSVSATAHAALYRFRYTGEGPRRLLVDTQWGIASEDRVVDRVRAAGVTPRADGISGICHLKQWVERDLAFVVEFDRPAASFERLESAPGEKGPRYVFTFAPESGNTIAVRLALSRTSVAAAKRNLVSELPGWDAEPVRAAARASWNKLLEAATIEGSEVQKKNWYTSLYHLYIQPNNVADVGETPFYSTFSCWDTFRAAGPLYTLFAPERASEFVASMLKQGEITGFLPLWTLWGVDNQCMIGTHSIPMIVDAWLKGCWPAPVVEDNDGTGERAYQQIKETLTQKHPCRVKENWDLYDTYGYYPFDKIRGESVSRTMECAYDDWCAARMAEKLGHAEDAAFFDKRAAYWKNVFDPSIGLVRGKDSYGQWRTPYDPFALGHGADLANDFTEGNAFQYSWHVMQDPEGLIAAMGGRDAFEKRLDSLFEQPTETAGMGKVLDVTGLIGQYVHGNEPSHHVIYFYPQVGHPEKAAARIHEVFDKFYLPKPDGLCGNDDCGQMSAWYLFSAMGFYPFNPCGGEYILGSPQIEKVTLRCSPSPSTFTSFTVVARGLSKENKYVKSVTLNGKPITDWKIRHADIVKGGELVFEMTAEAMR